MFIFKHATIAITLSSDCHLRAILTGSSSSSTLQTHRFHTKPYQTMLISRRESTKSGTPFAPTVAVSSSLGQDCKYHPLKKPALGARSRNKSTAATGETPHYQPVPSVVCSSSLPLISGTERPCGGSASPADGWLEAQKSLHSKCWAVSAPPAKGTKTHYHCAVTYLAV